MVQDIGLSKFIGQSFAGAGAGGHVTDFKCGGSDLRTEEGNVKQERRRGYGESYGGAGVTEGRRVNSRCKLGGGKGGSLRERRLGKAARSPAHDRSLQSIAGSYGRVHVSNSINTLLMCKGDGTPKVTRKFEASASAMRVTRATILPSMPLSTKLCSYAL
jgi:hypothetical protein